LYAVTPACADHREDPFHRARRDLGRLDAARGRAHGSCVRVEACGHFPDGKDEVGRLRGDRAGRHPVELRRLGILRQAEAGLGTDRLEAEGAVASRAREDDPDRAGPPIQGEGPEEGVDRQGHATRPADRLDCEHRIVQRHRVAARRHVDVVRQGPGLTGDLAHRHLGGLREDFREQALAGRSLVAHDDERQTGVRGE